MTETDRFPAYWNGEDTFATRRGGRWHVGGDVAPGDEGVLILLERNGSPAWFELRGNRLVFDDMEVHGSPAWFERGNRREGDDMEG